MSKEELETALSQRRPVPPLQHGKGVQLSVDQAASQEETNQGAQSGNAANKQKEETAVLQESSKINTQTDKGAQKQNGKVAKTKESVPAKPHKEKKAGSQKEEVAEEQEGEPTYEQLRELAKMVQRMNTRMQKSAEQKQQKEDPGNLLIQALAETQFTEFSRIAELQKGKINQGVTIPEALFTIYKKCAMDYGMRGKKIPMGDLIAKAMIKYLVEDILPELSE